MATMFLKGIFPEFGVLNQFQYHICFRVWMLKISFFQNLYIFCIFEFFLIIYQLRFRTAMIYLQE